MSIIDQKAYLKKYLCGKNKEDKKKKKRKKKPVFGDRVTIIDDDVDISHATTLAEAEEILALAEDAPQIVKVIDERPLHMSDLWKPMAVSDVTEGPDERNESRQKVNLSFTKKIVPKDDHKTGAGRINKHNLPKSMSKKDDDGPLSLPKGSNRRKRSSPPRRTGNSDSENGSPGRNSKKQHDSDDSLRANRPPRRRYNSDESPPRKKTQEADASPGVKRLDADGDTSPPRRKKTESDGDASPPRRKRQDSDSSPPRKVGRDDISPPRRIKRDADSSPPRRTDRRRRDSDSSPPRASNRNRPKSPPAAAKPVRKLLPGNKKGKYLIPQKRDKTLDGKSAGLQSKDELIKENQAFLQREAEVFKNMSPDVSGANAAPIMRDRKTGKVRDFMQEAKEREEKKKQEDASKEKYTRWGRGLKQVEAFEDRIQQDMHEMSKPLARYADDDDLEQFLKEQEREGDPMLDYIRKKKKKKVVESGKPLKPEYEGEFMPNRYGIRPGYRWDGVDRSNGYEKKWFEVQNSRQAQLEEIYKWSTEDM